MSEPWIAVDEAGFGWDLPLKPGYRSQLARLEAIEHAEAERERAEKVERAEDRLEAWMFHRASEMAANGEPFDLRDPASLMIPDAVLADRVFAAMDAESARQERRALIEAGLLTVLPTFVDRSPAPPSVAPSAQEGAARANPAATRARDALRRWAKRAAHSASGCRCASCTGEDVYRSTDATGSTITRYTDDPGRIVR